MTNSSEKMISGAVATGVLLSGVPCWVLGLYSSPLQAAVTTVGAAAFFTAIVWGVMRILED